MKKHAIVTLGAAVLAAGVSYAYGETAIPSLQSAHRAAQFADRFATLQGLSSNSSAFMRPADTAGATGAAATGDRMAGSQEQKMAHSADHALKAKGHKDAMAKMQHDRMSHDSSPSPGEHATTDGSPMRTSASQ